jgi:hypothetical protein
MTSKSLKQQLLGSWALVSYTVKNMETGALSHPFGQHPLGFVLYTADGYMSAQLQPPNRAPFSEGDFSRASLREYAEAASTYIAYSGRFFVDESRRALSHEMAVSLLPNWFGQRQTRLVELKGEYLQLSTELPIHLNGEPHTATLLWRRAPFN